MGHYFLFFSIGYVTSTEAYWIGRNNREERKVVEPEGETLVGSSGEALRPPGINIISFPDKCSLILDVSGQQSPFYSLFTLGALWSLGEPEQDERRMEEPEVCTMKQAEFDWACTWLEEGGAPVLAEDKAQGLLAQVFGLPMPLPLLFYASVLFLCPSF